MRFALLILVFVSSVWSTTETAEARPGDPVIQARKPQKAQKRRASTKVARAAKPTKATKTKPGKKASKPAKAVEVEADDAPEPVAKVESPVPARRSPVAQATDDEVPRNEPRRNKR